MTTEKIEKAEWGLMSVAVILGLTFFFGGSSQISSGAFVIIMACLIVVAVTCVSKLLRWLSDFVDSTEDIQRRAGLRHHKKSEKLVDVDQHRRPR